MAKYAKKSKKPKALKGFFIFICLVAVAVAGILSYLFATTQINHDKILDNVHIAGVDVGGMTKEEAIKAVSKVADSYSTQNLNIKIGEENHAIAPSLSGAALDVDAAVNTAYDYGRSGFLFRKYKEQTAIKTKAVDLDISKHLNLDTTALQEEIHKLEKQFNVTMVPFEYRLEGTMPTDENYEGGDRKLIIVVGRSGYVLNAETLYNQILNAYNKREFSFSAECEFTKATGLDLEGIYRDNCIAPTDATMDQTTFKITAHKNGYGFIPEDVKNSISQAEPGQELTVSFAVLPPEITREDLEKNLERDMFKDLLSEYTAKYGSSYNRDINLKLSTAAVNGTILLPGETFDYNSTLGERTPEAGYKLGNTYAGMETIQTYGGGICQTSSTVYYCALLADMEIISRTNHGFYTDYVPSGTDATVSWGGPEFRFKNSSKYPIKIEAYSEAGNVTVKIWGTDDKDYYVKMESEILGVYSWKTVYKEMEPNNSKGYKDGQVITSPYTGYKIQTYRCKYDKATDKLISKEPEALSVYSTRNKVVCKIVDKAPETTPTTPPATESTAPPTTEAPQPPETEPVTPPDSGITES